MPSIVTHFYHTTEVAERLPPYLKEYTLKFKDEFLQGGQGADLLFGLFYDKADYRRWGSEFHSGHNAQCFDALAKFAREDKSGRAVAYGLGMIAHYCLDRRLHPYIKFVSKEVAPKFCDKYYSTSTIHLRFEACLDAYLMKKIDKLPKKMAYAGKYLPITKQMLAMIDTLFCKVFAPIYGYTIKEGRVAKSTKRYKTFANITSSYSGIKYKVVNFLEPILTKRKLVSSYFRPTKLIDEIDCGNETKREFPEYIGGDKVVDYTALQLIKIATDESIDLCVQFYKAVSEGAVFTEKFGVNYAGELQ